MNSRIFELVGVAVILVLATVPVNGNREHHLGKFAFDFQTFVPPHRANQMNTFEVKFAVADEIVDKLRDPNPFTFGDPDGNPPFVNCLVQTFRKGNPTRGVRFWAESEIYALDHNTNMVKEVRTFRRKIVTGQDGGRTFSFPLLPDNLPEDFLNGGDQTVWTSTTADAINRIKVDSAALTCDVSGSDNPQN